MRAIMVIGTLTLTLTAACGSAGSNSSNEITLPHTAVSRTARLVVTSDAFADGSPIPRRFTCDGENAVPMLSWRGAPPGAKTIAVVVDDPDAPAGTFVHWIVVDLPPGTTSVPPVGAGAELANGAGRRGWTGPCPPPGKVHHYRFSVYALAEAIATGATTADALRLIKADAIASGLLTGTYRR